jgi:hypothetical protein
MAYDTYLNRVTGDWAFSSHGDFLGVSGDEFDRQRIWVRAKIPRGTFTYDTEGTLGSELYRITRNPTQRQLEAAISAMFTALEGISGISVNDVQGEIDVPAQKISLNVLYTKVGGIEESEVFEFDLAQPLQQGTEFGIFQS